MTGPEHYQEAEFLLDAVTTPSQATPGRRVLYADADPEVIAVAYVHATLALAAATAMGLPDPPADDWNAWREVAATKSIKTGTAPGRGDSGELT